MTLSLAKGRGEGVHTHWRAHFRNAERDLAQHAAHLPIVELRSSREVREFVAGLAAAERKGIPNGRTDSGVP